MPVSRRTLLTGAALAAGGFRPAFAAGAYPTKPIALIVGYTPGAITDYSARVIAEAMSARLGQTVLVENKPGAASMIAVDGVTKSAPDGYTLMFGNADATAMLTAERPTMPYKIVGDFTYISRLVQFPLIMMVNTSRLPDVKTPTDLIAHAKANPGKLRYSTTGPGGASHLASLLFQKQTGTEMVAVPYRGAAPALTDLLGGFVDLTFLTFTTLGDNVHSPKLKLLATTGPVRDPNVPDLPTMTELGFPGATLIDWFGILGPAKMPDDVVARLRKAIDESLNDPAVVKRFTSVDLQPAPLTGDAFQKLVVDQYHQWKAIADAAHIVIE